MPPLSRRRLLAGATALFTAGCNPVPDAAAAALAQPLDLQLPPGSALQSLGGLVLDNAALGFGGLSGLHLAPDLQVTAVSDLGRWMQARLVLREGRLAGLTGLRSGRLQDGSGQALQRGYAGDAESLARLPDGTWLVGFERWHRIRAFRDLSGPGRYMEAPPGLERAPTNAGLEALAVLADGRWLAIAEGLAPPEDSALRLAWLGGPGRWSTLAYRPRPSFHPVDATGLPDGGALVLERGFSIFGGFDGRLVRLPAPALASPGPGTVLRGEEILRLQHPLPSDNWEGVAAARSGGRTLVALCSDNNENPLQRSLLLLFALADD